MRSGAAGAPWRAGWRSALAAGELNGNGHDRTVRFLEFLDGDVGNQAECSVGVDGIRGSHLDEDAVCQAHRVSRARRQRLGSVAMVKNDGLAS
jgi:hypothetical protein